MKIMVTGSRHHDDVDLIWDALDETAEFWSEITLMEGGALGADRIAREWAQSINLAVATYEADWVKHGRAAGPIRNQAMVDDRPDIVLAFPLDDSRGTYDAIRRARAAGIEVRIYK